MIFLNVLIALAFELLGLGKIGKRGAGWRARTVGLGEAAPPIEVAVVRVERNCLREILDGKFGLVVLRISIATPHIDKLARSRILGGAFL